MRAHTANAFMFKDRWTGQSSKRVRFATYPVSEGDVDLQEIGRHRLREGRDRSRRKDHAELVLFFFSRFWLHLTLVLASFYYPSSRRLCNHTAHSFSDLVGKLISHPLFCWFGCPAPSISREPNFRFPFTAFPFFPFFFFFSPPFSPFLSPVRSSKCSPAQSVGRALRSLSFPSPIGLLFYVFWLRW